MNFNFNFYFLPQIFKILNCLVQYIVSIVLNCKDVLMEYFKYSYQWIIDLEKQTNAIHNSLCLLEYDWKIVFSK